MTIDRSVMQQIVDEKVRFWIDKYNKNSVYAEFRRKNGAICLEPYESEFFRSFLGYKYRKMTHQRVSPNFNEILKIKRQDIIFEENRYIKINRRVAGSLRGRIVYFLADEMWQSVVIEPKGWTIKKQTKEKFIKTDLDMEQVEPVGGGNCMDLLKPYINLPTDDFKLLTVCLIQFFSRQSNHYAMVISSAKGTGKSTLTKLIRSLIDPSYAETSLTPNNESELKNLLANSSVVCFDNTTVMKESYSDILCGAITGTTDAKRKLFTDNEQVILDLHNIVILNGIDIVPYKSDLAQRSLLFELQRIEKKNRMTDSDFWSRFNQDKPRILGAIFDTLQKAMTILPTLEVDGLERMADAYKEMIAIAMALGISSEEFQVIFESNQKKLQTSYAQNNSFINLVVNFVEHNKRIDKPAGEVYESMLASIVGKCKGFPDGPSPLSRKLNIERDTLRDLGIRFDTHRNGSANYIILEKIPKNKLTSSQIEKKALWEKQFGGDNAST